MCIIETVNDPHHVKSPLPGTNTTSHSNNSRPASRTGSFKGPLKGGGFLSLLLCCTFGAGSLLDNSDKSAPFFTRHRKKNNNNNNRHSHTSTTASTDIRSPVVEKNITPSSSSSPSPPTCPPALPKILTHPTDLANFSSSSSSSAAAAATTSPDQQEDPPVTSATPRSLPPQSPDVGSSAVYWGRKEKGREQSTKGVISCMNRILICWLLYIYRVRSCGFCRLWLQSILDVNAWYWIWMKHWCTALSRYVLIHFLQIDCPMLIESSCYLGHS